MDRKDGTLVGKEGREGGQKACLAGRMMDDPLERLDRQDPGIGMEGKMHRGSYFIFNYFFFASSSLKLS